MSSYKPVLKQTAEASKNGYQATVSLPKAQSAKEVMFISTEDSQQATPLPAFPVHVFPKPVRELIESASILNYPLDFVGTAALTALATAIGDTHRLQIKTGWQEPATLFAAIVGTPGVRKTPAINYALKPLQRWQEKQLRTYQVEREAYLKEVSRIRQQKGDETIPVEPKPTQVLVDNFTIEALICLLYNNLRGLLCKRDELTSWVRDMNRYNKGSDEQQWLSIWSAQSIMSNRKSQNEVFYIPRPIVNVIGGIQPKILPELFAEAKSANGFSDRILFCWPNPINRTFSEEEVPVYIEEQYQKVFDRLLALTMNADCEGHPVPHVIKLAPEAYTRFVQWDETFINAKLNDPTVGESEKSVIAKLEAYMLRFALVLHLTAVACQEAPAGQVSLSTVEGAISLVDYFAANATKVMNQVGMGAASPFDKSLSYIKRKHNSKINKRDLYRSKVGGINTLEQANAFIEEVELKGLGIVERQHDKHGGPPQEILTLYT
jgi:hypothetical protein